MLAALLAALLALRLTQLQVGESGRLAAQAELSRVHRLPLEAERGIIYDRHGRQLVTNQPAWALSLVPAALPLDARARQRELAEVAAAAGIPEAVLAATLAAATDSYTPAPIRGRIDDRQAQALRERLPGWTGVSLDFKPVRTYVDPLVFGHVLGYTAPLDGQDYAQLRASGYRADETMGKAGVEAGLESVLRGADGWSDVEYDASGQVVKTVAAQPSQPGQSVYLSLDAGLQTATVQYLQEGLKELGKQAGAAMVVDPSTGEVLAMASAPSLDTNLFTGGISQADYSRLLADPAKPLYDRALNGLYAPGSTFKMITAAAALQEGKISPSTTLGCPAAISYGGWTYANWAGYDMGPMNVTRAIALSCDTFFYRVADMVGDTTLASYAKAFGYGAAPRFQIPGASAGVAPDSNWLADNCQAPQGDAGEPPAPSCRWNPGETLTMGIGQSYLLTTPLIQSMYIAALANGGTLYNPNLVHQVRDGNGGLVSTGAPSVVRQVPVSPDAMATVREGMRLCLADPHGTGYQFRLAGWPATGGCKTGTAQYGGSGLDLPTHAWFTFFTPFDNPEIAMVVMVEGGGEGDQAAEPIALKIAQYYLAHRAEIRS